MRVAVVGAGAVGGYFGGRLAEAGEDVVFVARGNTLRVLQQEGLRVDSPKGDISLPSVVATDSPAEIGPVDAVILGVKAWQVSEVADAIRPLVGDTTCILPLQNGVEATRQLSAIHGEEHVLGGLCRILSKIAAPGHITHLGIDPFIALGELDNRSSDRVNRLAASLQSGGTIVQNPPDIHRAMWLKFLLMASLSGVGAVTRVPVGVFRSTAGTRNMLESAIEEVYAVGKASGIALSHDDVSKTLTFVDGLPADGMSSMQRDIMDGRPSELESQTGAVVRIGKSVGVPTPTHAFIYNALLPLDSLVRRQ